MSKKKWFNTIGLILGMGGVVIIFFYRPPQPVFHSYLALQNQNPSLEELKEIHNIWSRIGLLMIGIGFLIQLIAVWIKPNN